MFSLSGRVLSWVCELDYLGVYVLSSRQFKISLQNAKRSFYRAVNSIFGKTGRIASEEVIIQVIKSKYNALPVAPPRHHFRI